MTALAHILVLHSVDLNLESVVIAQTTINALFRTPSLCVCTALFERFRSLRQALTCSSTKFPALTFP